MKRAEDALDAKEYQDALHAINDALYYEPASPQAFFLFGCSMLAAEQPGIARLAFQEVLRQMPSKWQAMSNMARCYEDLERHDMSEGLYKKALRAAPDNLPSMIGMSTLCVQTGRHRDCLRWADKALRVKDVLQARVNKAFAHLHLGEHEEGWKLYAMGVGHQQWRDRKFHFLDDGEPEPIWNGEKDAKLLITGEQGIGDQIAFLSVIPDMLAQGYQIAAIECYPKLRNLLQRSFPCIPVYGTQFTDPPGWRVDFTHSCAMSELMQHFRKTGDDYSGTPYLCAEEDQVQQWELFLQSKGDGPRIGVAWNGGSRRSHAWRHKSIDLDYFRPVFEAFPGAHFVSLEYKDPGNLSDWPIDHYQWATMTDDYENTAALVKNLDAVVSVPTSVCHLAGAMDVPTFCSVHENAHFHYTMGMPYHSSVKLFKRDDLPELIAAMQRHFYAA